MIKNYIKHFFDLYWDNLITITVRNKKIYGLIIIFCLINLPTVNSSLLNYDNDTTINIEIIDVIDGFGIDVIIKNNGDADVEDILLEIEIDDVTVIIPKKQYKIQFLSEGDSTNIHIYLFGFNLGLIRNYSIIKFIIKNEESTLLEAQITAIIIGPFVSIISKYFDDDVDNDGYILFCPMWSTNTYLINKEGQVVHSWKNSLYPDSQSTYLLENGDLVRTSFDPNSLIFGFGIQGTVEIIDWNDTLVWKSTFVSRKYIQHHDIQPLPNGNFLLIEWEQFTREEAENAGRDSNNIPGNFFFPDRIIEIQLLENSRYVIVWEGHAWDHLVQDLYQSKDNYGVISDHPELIDINFGGGTIANGRIDWLHVNSIDYNPEYDQILLSVKYFNEIWVIDHSTTTEESAGH